MVFELKTSDLGYIYGGQRPIGSALDNTKTLEEMLKDIDFMVRQLQLHREKAAAQMVDKTTNFDRIAVGIVAGIITGGAIAVIGVLCLINRRKQHQI